MIYMDMHGYDYIDLYGYASMEYTSSMLENQSSFFPYFLPNPTCIMSVSACG